MIKYAASLLALTLPVAAFAQSESTQPPAATDAEAGNTMAAFPEYNPDNFGVTVAGTEPMLFHKQSKALCINAFGSIPLVATVDYSSGDGMDVGCNYMLKTSGGLASISLYFYSRPDITAAGEHKGAVAAINQRAKREKLTISRRDESEKACVTAMNDGFLGDIAKRNTADGLEAPTQKDAPQFAFFHLQGAPQNGFAGPHVTSMLATYGAGDWMVKVRITLPTRDERMARTACGMATEAIATQIPLLSRKPSGA